MENVSRTHQKQSPLHITRSPDWDSGKQKAGRRSHQKVKKLKITERKKRGEKRISMRKKKLNSSWLLGLVCSGGSEGRGNLPPWAKRVVPQLNLRPVVPGNFLAPLPPPPPPPYREVWITPLVCLSVCRCVHLHVCLSDCPSDCPSICLLVCLTVYDALCFFL